MYENCKIYGPYNRNDGRQHVITIQNGIKRTVSYPKFLMEKHIGRFLLENETIHHKDGNPKNNNVSNLEIKLKKEHSRLHSLKYISESFICPICNKKFTLEGKRLRKFYSNKRLRKSKGPFCSKSCVGKYGKKIQMGD